MRRPFASRRDHMLEPLSLNDTPRLAALHQEDFPRPWTEDEFSGLLSQAGVFGFGVREVGKGDGPPIGFVLARLAAGEGEILTVAVARSQRRQGLGWRLMDAVLRELHRERAEALFLEVDEANMPAVALYRRLGFREVGKRPDYYPSAGPGNALVMRRDLHAGK